MMTVLMLTGLVKDLITHLQRHVLMAFLLSSLTLMSAKVLSAMPGPVFEAPVHQHEERLARLQSLADELREGIPRSGRFEQFKHLAILSQPLRSTGEFSLAANGDFRWQINTPYSVGYHQRDGELMRDVDGQTEVVSATQEPALYGFFQFFSRIFELDYEALNELFEVYLLMDDADTSADWQLGLVPRDRRLRETIARLLIVGDAGDIHEVFLYESGEDMTRLLFSYPGHALP